MTRSAAHRLEPDGMAEPPEREVIHTLKNHLSVIIVLTELVMSELPADAPAREDLAHVRKAAVDALALTPQLR